MLSIMLDVQNAFISINGIKYSVDLFKRLLIKHWFGDSLCVNN